MARRKTTTRTKLIGWGVLALGVLVIIGIFVISRAFTTPGAPGTIVASTSSAVSSASAATSSSAASSAAPSEAATSSSAAVAPVAPAAQQGSSSAALQVIPDTMDQGQRKALLTALIGQGVFTGVQVDNPPPKVGVTPLFQGLSDDLKQQFIATVYAYVNNGGAGKDPLELVDATNGKTIGTYTAADGLKLS